MKLIEAIFRSNLIVTVPMFGSCVYTSHHPGYVRVEHLPGVELFIGMYLDTNGTHPDSDVLANLFTILEASETPLVDCYITRNVVLADWYLTATEKVMAAVYPETLDKWLARADQNFEAEIKEFGPLTEKTAQTHLDGIDRLIRTYGSRVQVTDDWPSASALLHEVNAHMPPYNTKYSKQLTRGLLDVPGFDL